MIDITMCKNHKCDKKRECYRYMAFPNIHGQSYAKFGKKKGEKMCQSIYPMRTGLGSRYKTVSHLTNNPR